MRLPWKYQRRIIAERWHCKPYEVDWAPTDEVELEVEIINLEGEAAVWHQQHQR